MAVAEPALWRVLTVLLMAVLIKWLVRKLGVDCHECAGRMAFFDELAIEEQNAILAYFSEHEGRKPDTSAVFVCKRCGFVYDDFSGEKRSMSGDEVGHCKICGRPTVRYMGWIKARAAMPAFREKNKGLIKQYECLTCRRDPHYDVDCVMCDAEPKLLGCDVCRTVYAWKSVDGSDFRFLVPLTDGPVLQEPLSDIAL